MNCGSLKKEANLLTEVVGLISPPPVQYFAPLPFFFSREFQNFNYPSFFQCLVGELPPTPKTSIKRNFQKKLFARKKKAGGQTIVWGGEINPTTSVKLEAKRKNLYGKHEICITEVVGLIAPPSGIVCPLPFFFSQEIQNLNFWSGRCRTPQKRRLNGNFQKKNVSREKKRQRGKLFHGGGEINPTTSVKEKKKCINKHFKIQVLENSQVTSFHID